MGTITDKLDSLTKRRRDFIWLLLLATLSGIVTYSLGTGYAAINDSLVAKPSMWYSLTLIIPHIVLMLSMMGMVLVTVLLLYLALLTLLQRGLAAKS